jgi:hypothetical protein
LKLRVTSHSSSKLATSNSLASPESSVLHYLILFLLCIVVFHSLSVRHYLCFLLVFELLSVHNSETATLKQGLHLPRFDLQRLSTPPAFATPLHISLASTGRFCHFSTKEQTNPSAKQKHLSHPPQCQPSHPAKAPPVSTTTAAHTTATTPQAATTQEPAAGGGQT